MPDAYVDEHAAIKARTSASVSTSSGNRRLCLGFRGRGRRRPVHPLDNRGVLIAVEALNPAISCHFLPSPGPGPPPKPAGVPPGASWNQGICATDCGQSAARSPSVSQGWRLARGRVMPMPLTIACRSRPQDTDFCMAAQRIARPATRFNWVVTRYSPCASPTPLYLLDSH